jgi:hypothetical protein
MTDKPFNDGEWTQGRMDAFIKGLIREGLTKWGPRHECIKQSRVRRGWYLCAVCKQEVPTSIKRELKTKPGVWKKTKNIYADHIEPIIDPAVGRRSWDEVIKRAFVDLKEFQAVCYACHESKTAEERSIATERKRHEREQKL